MSESHQLSFQGRGTSPKDGGLPYVGRPIPCVYAAALSASAVPRPAAMRAGTGTPARAAATYAPPPKNAVVAYMSEYECRIRAGRLQSTSLIMPPNVAVIIPQAAAAIGGTPARIPFCAPMTQKAATPHASHASIHGSSTESPSFGPTVGQKKNVPSDVPMQRYKYSISSIQNAGLASMNPRMVPPPTAVIVPTIVAPSASIPARPAVTVPDIANATVPL
mmetsp:Transcript_27969/g.91478  ORF Transcript_27969/g.91478 Transcript_27969/m.91478 type:complete len:220 (+) Transcript_27969:30-689(+)